MTITQLFGPKTLHGEIAVVTGGGSGIGYGIARDFVACGATVVITSRSAERLKAAELSIAEETGQLCGSLPCDVREEADVARLHDYVRTMFGPASIVVNNAAANFFVPAERMNRRALDSVVSTDLFGTFAVTRAFVPGMIEQRRGNILNITLAAPERGFPGFAHCGAAKAAIVSLTASWAYEWGRYGIRVNAIAPGPVPTTGVDMSLVGARDREETIANAADELPLRRFGTVEDISALAVFLCSSGASWITGANMVVDGGMSVNRAPKTRFQD